MRLQVLKALANPARIFYVPYTLAVINFVVQFLIYVVVLTVDMLFGGSGITPLWFMGSVIIVHMILAVFSKRDPQLGQIMAAQIQLLKQRIPRRLAA